MQCSSAALWLLLRRATPPQDTGEPTTHNPAVLSHAKHRLENTPSPGPCGRSQKTRLAETHAQWMLNQAQ
jgi:hypothetical protein